MNKLSQLSLAAIVAAVMMLPAAQAANMTKVDYKAGKERISADNKTDKAACASLAANAKDICVEEAKAKKKVAYAELEYAYTGKAGDQNKVQTVKADTVYEVAKERCDDKAGNDKDVCVKEAKAVHVKALADAKVVKEVVTAKKDASADKLDADYKVALEKCDALTGDPKASCIAAAKAKFGKA